MPITVRHVGRTTDRWSDMVALPAPDAVHMIDA